MPSVSRMIVVVTATAWRAGNGPVGWQNGPMPMRQDCKHFESRSYPNGDTVRKCDLDLAPEAPWRCPSDCQRYTRRLVDVNWQHGTLVTPETPKEPVSLDDDDGSIAALLDAAEDIVNAAGQRAMADVEAERAREAMPRWKRIFTRGRRQDGGD